MNVVTRKLIAKELHVNRWLILGAIASSLLSVAVAATGRVGFNIGALTWLTSIIAFGVIIATYGVAHERKENSLLFVLSLPLGPRDYLLAKIAGLLFCYLIVWVGSVVPAVALVLHTGLNDGMAIYLILLAVFLLANFSLVLCGALHTRSEGAMTAVIVITNMFVTLYMFGVAMIPAIASHMTERVIRWGSTETIVLAGELGVLALALSLPFFIAARRRDFL